MLEPESDVAFTHWVDAHPDGFVLNTRASPAPTYMILHKASCSSISPDRKGIEAGAYTQRAYRKICADDVEELRSWVQRHGRSDGSFSGRCKMCAP
jgi:hypothetical protein